MAKLHNMKILSDKYNPARRKMAVWTGVIFICIFLVACLSWINCLGKTPQKIVQGLNTPGGHSTTIASSIEITDHRAGRKTVSLKVATLGVEKKKLGFLRLGFMKIACLKDVSMDWYDYSDSNDFSADGLSGTGPAGQLISQANKLKQYLPGPIKGIEMEQVEINFFKKDKLLSKISANRAHIMPRNRRLEFKDNVQITTCDGKQLSGSKFTWLMDTGKLVTSKAWELETDQQQVRGKGLETNIELKNINSVL